MVHRWNGRTTFRVLFALYVAGLLTWLGLGLVPEPMSGPGMAAAMADRTTALQTTVQYLFSALNVALGLLLVARRPDQTVPRLLGLALLGTAATFNLPSHRVFHLIGTPWPIATIHFTFHIVSGVAYVWAVVLFPDGRLPDRLRIGRSALAALVVGTTAVVSLVSWRGSFLAHPQFFVVFFGIGVALVGVGAQSVRILDPATPARERATARLLCAALLPAFAAAVLWLGARAVVLAGGGSGADSVVRWVQDLFPAAFAVVPVVLCAGVARYRLWDVDRLLTRVLVYGFLVLAVGAAYVAAVTAGGWLAGGGVWVSVAVLAVVAVAFEPLRAVGRRWANRVVFGQVLSPAEAMHRLVDSLEHVPPGGELRHLAQVTVAATRADSAQVWLLDGDRLVLAVAAPDDSRTDRERDLVGADRSADALTRAVDGTRGWPVRHRDELLGLLVLGVPPATSLGSADAKVAGDIAAHAGLVVHNARLMVSLARQVADLAARAEELRAVRRALVTAQDAERRRLERDLHDGAQQALVATVITVRACLAHPPVTPTETDELREMLRIARESVDDLCGDGRPEVLVRLGLRQALERSAQLGRHAGLAVDVDVDPAVEGALRPEVEAAVYFCCLEGLQNVTKYAGAMRAAIGVEVSGREVAFWVVDDGTGLRGVGADGPGGLPKLSERLAVLGGTLSVGAGPGGGVAIRGRVPIGREALVPA